MARNVRTVRAIVSVEVPDTLTPDKSFQLSRVDADGDEWVYYLRTDTNIEKFRFKYLVDSWDGTSMEDFNRTFVIPKSKRSIVEEKLSNGGKILIEISSVFGLPDSQIRIFVPNHISAVVDHSTASSIFHCVDSSSLHRIKDLLSQLRIDKDKLKSEILAMSANFELLSTITNERIEDRECDLRIQKIMEEINDIKGKLRVLVRFRPLLNGESEQSNYETTKSTVVIHDYSDIYNPIREYSMDQVYDQKVSNENIFNEARIGSLIKSSVLLLNNTCIFSYGQTCSGKTHTMVGCSLDDEGIIPRSLRVIFDTLSNVPRFVHVELVEIYRENIFSLFPKTQVSSCEDAMQLYHSSIRNRATASTHLNDASSRSHCAFIITLTANPTVNAAEARRSSSIFLVDLAGSERTKVSGAEGDRLAEANAINKSLSTLGVVLNGLLNKQKFVPYRDSKLTRLLAPVFNRTNPASKIVMIANVSPNVSDLKETISTLAFAHRVGKVEMREDVDEQAIRSKLEQVHELSSARRNRLVRRNSFCV